MEKLFIVGFGPGDERLQSTKTKEILSSAQRILSTSRISQSDNQIENIKLSELLTELRRPQTGITVVLVSGDCCFFSISKQLVNEFSNIYDIELVSGISSIQYFSAKLAVTYDDALITSMHGRDGRIVPKVCYNKKVFALTGGDFKAHDICSSLWESGLGNVKIWVGEKLSYPNERIVHGTASELKELIFDDLSVMYIENTEAQNPYLPLRDDDFIRRDVPMTKEEVRWLTLQKLQLSQYDIVYDIGAGTGSVSIEMARKVCNGFVYAIENKAEAYELILENRKKHGAYNLSVIKAKAPDGMAYLPIPQKVFIGGSSGNMDEIVKCVVDRNSDVRIVANAITLQSISQILQSFEKHGLTNIDTICVNISKSKKLGTYDMMMAQNPVYIVTGCRV